MKKGDRELGAVTVSFIRPEHYPQGIRESHDVHDMTGNMFFDYTIFGYRRALPVIRKKAQTMKKREPAARATKKSPRKASLAKKHATKARKRTRGPRAKTQRAGRFERATGSPKSYPT